ncbi:CTP synthase [Deferribacterales bacterium RsTz2092]|nr:CTP synthase [Deferribacterales bacterium]
MTRFIFVTGGVVSSLGKGMSAATVGALLRAHGFKVRMRKLDPYLNIDPGTMSPLQHGEVYVTEDGAETDLDLGHYERFLHQFARSADSTSGGKIYNNVLVKERRGDYLGATVQMIPNVTDEIKDFIRSDLTDEDFVICEVGGTVGDIESLVFLEAIRQFSNDIKRKNAMFIHLTLLPYIETAKELKTKPTQHSVRNLLEKGIQPDMLICRSTVRLAESERKKIALFCNVEAENIIPALDVDNVYKLPLIYREEGVDTRLLEYFGIESKTADMSDWERLAERIDNVSGETTLALVVKYAMDSDAYKSLKEAIYHAGLMNGVKVKIKWIDAEMLENVSDDVIAAHFKGIKGLIVPGGFGVRGTEGKINAIRYAREHKLPYLGICLGMQLAVIEFARHVMNIDDAGSTEFERPCTPVISLMTEWNRDGEKAVRSKNSNMGGTLRLGAYPCVLKEGTVARRAYGQPEIRERHRHRYEMNIGYLQQFEKAGLIISGRSPDGELPEMVELAGYPFFVGVQFHPELKSNPFDAHPLFVELVKNIK